MSATLNRVQLIGRLGADPETRFTPKGSKVCQFRIAVDDRWRTPEGETRERTDWFRIEAWGRLGEICQEYLTKGRLVLVEGRLQNEQYEQNGEKRSVYKIKATTMQMLDRKPEEVTLEARFIDDLGADSLDLTELLMALEEEYNIDIDDEANTIQTVGDAVDYIKTKLG